MAHNILLESGTNEMELLVFRVGNGTYGINVAKVRELLKKVNTVTVPHAPKAVEGSFQLRDEVLTLVNLAQYLEVESSVSEENRLIIIIELNNTRCGILVDGVEIIYRLRWDQIDPPSDFLAHTGAPITATARVQDRVVLVLDFENILGELLGVGSVSVPPKDVIQRPRGAGEANVLVADDSPIIRQTVEKVLRMAGFEKLTICSDGEQAWEELIKAKEGAAEPFHLVLTDIEMPRMDGLHLTARIKNDTKLAHTPVILFSSIISEDTINKGRSVSADAQVAKSDTQKLLQELHRCINII